VPPTLTETGPRVFDTFEYASNSTTNSSNAASTSHGSASESSSTDSAVPPQSSNPSTGLSTGAKAGIGVGAALAITAVIIIFLFIIRKRKRTRNAKLTAAPNSRSTKQTRDMPGFDDKLEMHDGSYNPALAGKVNKKDELDSVARSPGTEIATELEEKPSLVSYAHELPIPSNSGTASSKSAHGSVPNSLIARKPVNTPTAASEQVMEPSISRSDQTPGELAEEVDLLVSELGILTKRRRALVASAEAAGVRLDALEGRKGEDLRELDAREQRVRSRLAELQKDF
jgi:hypothetical protein